MSTIGIFGGADLSRGGQMFGNGRLERVSGDLRSRVDIDACMQRVWCTSCVRHAVGSIASWLRRANGRVDNFHAPARSHKSSSADYQSRGRLAVTRRQLARTCCSRRLLLYADCPTAHGEALFTAHQLNRAPVLDACIPMRLFTSHELIEHRPS